MDMQGLLDKTTALTNIAASTSAAVDGILTEIAKIKVDLQAAIDANDPVKLQAVSDSLDASINTITANKDKLVAATQQSGGVPPVAVPPVDVPPVDVPPVVIDPSLTGQ